MKYGPVYFVSGIDTGIGKTYATGLMARWLKKSGRTATTVKMVQTGNDRFWEDNLHSADVELHRKICGETGEMRYREKRLRVQQTFPFPASPDLAARKYGGEFEYDSFLYSVEILRMGGGTVLVEGAGGLAAPLTQSDLPVDFAAGQKWKLILVTCGRLGSINHTILSLEAASARKMEVAGVVHNWHPEADPEIDADAQEYVQRWMRTGLPGKTPFVAVPRFDAEGPYPETDFSEIFA